MLFALNPEWDEVQVGKGRDFPVDKTAIKIHFTQFRFHRILLWNGVDRGCYPHKGWKETNTKSTQFRYFGGKTAVLRPKSAFLSLSEISTLWKTRSKITNDKNRENDPVQKSAVLSVLLIMLKIGYYFLLILFMQVKRLSYS